MQKGVVLGTVRSAYRVVIAGTVARREKMELLILRCVRARDANP